MMDGINKTLLLLVNNFMDQETLFHLELDKIVIMITSG